MKNYLFIDNKAEITEGERAKEMLKEKNDFQFFSKGDGVVKVSKERWKEAQDAEYTHWFKHGLGSSDDRNLIHFEKFDRYLSIKDRIFENAIELGCGPFTNIGLLLNSVKINNITLLDPLLNEYLKHPNATYNESTISLRKTHHRRSIRSFSERKIQQLTGSKIFETQIPISKYYSCPIEEFKTNTKFDLVILVNVLEHCYDTKLIFEKVHSILNTGGIFVFHDKYYKNDNIEDTLPNYYDSAHPLKTEGRVIEQFLSEQFNLIYKRIDAQDQMWRNIHEQREIVYFIGSKKNN